jgi:hypothetical protein
MPADTLPEALETIDLGRELTKEQLRKIICALQAELWRVRNHRGIPVERAA